MLYFRKVCAVCGNLQLAWATFVCPNGTLVPNPEQEKDVSVFLILVFSKATQSRKAPPAISLRLFQRDHFVETAPQVLVSRTAYSARASVARFLFITHFISSLLLYFCQFDFIYSFKNKVLRSVRISNQPAGHYQISNSL